MKRLLHSLLSSFLLLNSMVLFGLLLLVTVLVTWQLQQLTYDRGLSQLHHAGQGRLLFHISGIRRNLNRTRIMPFALAQNSDVIALLEHPGDASSSSVDRLLEQMNQVAGSRRWDVLSPEAQVVASSDWRTGTREHPDMNQIAGLIEQAVSGEHGYFFKSQGAGGVPVYLLSTPIYGRTGLIGVGLVTVSLDRLEESWTATDETLLVSDTSRQVFLSNSEHWRYRNLPSNGGKVVLTDVAATSLTGHVSELHDGTRVMVLSGAREPVYLLQSVLLDDLNWEVHFLSELKPLLQRQRSVLMFSIGGGLALVLLVLLLRERLLKNRLHAEADAMRLRNEAQQRAIIGSTQVGLITLDQRGHVRTINPEAMNQLGVREAVIGGRSMAELLDPDVGPEALRTFPDKLRCGETPNPVQAVEGRALRGDGSSFPALLSINPLKWEEGDGYLVTIVDISRRKRAEQALQQANDQLEQRVQQRTAELHRAQRELIQQSKLAALGTMSAAIAHELNQPLTAIQTSVFSGRLLMERGDTKALASNLDRIAAMSERMALITGQLKVFAHQRVETAGPVSADDAIDQVLNLLGDRIEQQKVSVDRQRRPALRLYGDQPRIEQVLINLVRNALDAVQAQPTPSLMLLVSEEEASRQVCICVCDNGPGLSEAVLEHLFDPFFTTKEVGEGLGLGLSISYGIARDLGGQIRAENRIIDGVVQGACFSLWLPLYDEHEERMNDE